MSTIILNVIIILGIIIAGGFLIFFVGDLLLSIVDPKSDERKIKNKRKKDVEKMNEKLSNLSEEGAQRIRENEQVKEVFEQAENDSKEKLVGGGVVESYGVENIELEEKAEPQEEQKDDSSDEDEEAERRLKEARESLERRKAEILRRLQADLDDEDDEDEEEKVETENSENTEEKSEVESAEENKEAKDSDSAEVVEEEPAEVVEEEPAEAVEEEVAQVVEDESIEEESEEQSNDELAQERKALESERARYQELIKELEKKKESIAQSMDASEIVAEAKILSGKDEYIARLKEKEEALAANEKELKACKKEYMPLFRVQKTLEKDEKKLRIKEAQVAKQKVVLYGVNNYGDIDEEKAKKLSEELDLLDGLKLSVQHCREVMEVNKDRLPILEKMHAFLENQNKELKADVSYIKEMLKKFED